MGDAYYCLWCAGEVLEAGDTCNLVCYSLVVNAINMATYLQEMDEPPKDMHLQPWYPALANTQEGISEH